MIRSNLPKFIKDTIWEFLIFPIFAIKYTKKNHFCPMIFIVLKNSSNSTMYEIQDYPP